MREVMCTSLVHRKGGQTSSEGEIDSPYGSILMERETCASNNKENSELGI